MQEEILSLAKKLIAIQSTKDNPKELERVLETVLSYLNEFPKTLYRKDKLPPSAIVYNFKPKSGRFRLVLNAHLDVVPANKNLFEPKIKNGKLFGRGAYDMKAAAAAEVLLFKNIAPKVRYPLALQLVTDEETGGQNGTALHVKKGLKTDFVVSGDTTNFCINNQAKGILWLKVKTQGVSAHGAHPWEGENAIWKMINFLNKLKKEFPVPKYEVWKTTVNLARIETPNQSFNKVPDECVAFLDIRYISQDKKSIRKRIRKIGGKNVGIEIEMFEPEHYTSPKSPLLEKFSSSFVKITQKKPSLLCSHGASDLRYFNKIGSQGICFSPKGHGLHSDNEWVNISSLVSFYKILEDFLLGLGDNS